jgi:hypothetical protein
MEDPARARNAATSRPSPTARPGAGPIAGRADAEASRTQLSERGLRLGGQSFSPTAGERGVSLDLVSLHLLRAIAKAAARGRATDLEALAADIGVRKVDCRAALSTLHRQGYVDVLRMRPTLQGFALGASIRNATLEPVRGAAVAATRAA